MNGCPRQNPAYRPAPASSLRACPERARRPPSRPLPTLRGTPDSTARGPRSTTSSGVQLPGRRTGSSRARLPREHGLPGPSGTTAGPFHPSQVGSPRSGEVRALAMPGGSGPTREGCPRVPGSRAPRCRRSREARGKGQGWCGFGIRFLFVLVFLLSANNTAHNNLNFIFIFGSNSGVRCARSFARWGEVPPDTRSFPVAGLTHLGNGGPLGGGGRWHFMEELAKKVGVSVDNPHQAALAGLRPGKRCRKTNPLETSRRHTSPSRANPTSASTARAGSGSRAGTGTCLPNEARGRWSSPSRSPPSPR